MGQRVSHKSQTNFLHRIQCLAPHPNPPSKPTAACHPPTPPFRRNPLLPRRLRRHTPHPASFPESAACHHHHHPVGPNQCCSAVVQHIAAPVHTVWSVLRQFDNPQAYKHFVKSCRVVAGNGDVGTLRQVKLVSGLPAESSTERLEILDEERYVLSFRVVGGKHRLTNYRSVTTLHAAPEIAEGGAGGTVVVESYVVDVPPGNTGDDTRVFVDTIINCNLKSLARIAENRAAAAGGLLST
ncbi:abscisic acid receptor PYL4-like [Phalaenopsis equestris]|uniref:abscisic acid receptor PYL4-like n=1 Tax=Phalaenopsis equestris TaxID=78828 RepID=UPI0009E5AA0F|nr:abscisic acid receptor PYL4-like [Phalaenopsis equestris]